MADGVQWTRRRCVVVTAMAILFLCTYIASRDAAAGSSAVVHGVRLDEALASPADPVPHDLQSIDGPSRHSAAPLPSGVVTWSIIHSRCAAFDDNFRSNTLFRPATVTDEDTNDPQPSVLQCAPPYASYHVDRAPVCVAGNRFYRLARSAQRFPHMNRSALLEPLASEGDFVAAAKGASRLHFHRAVALMLTGTWNSVNWYHLLMDYLLGLCHMDLQFKALRDLPRRVVHIVNTTWNTKWGKHDQAACLEFSDAFSTVGEDTDGDLPERIYDSDSRKVGHPGELRNSGIGSLASTTATARRSLVARSFQDDTMHCFCGAVVVGEAHTLPRGEPQEGFRSPTRHTAMLRYKELMLRKYNTETPYGELPPVAAYTRLGYWTGEGARNASLLAGAPRLLLVKRRKRRIANSDAIEAMARAMGYNVAAVYFESLDPAAQFHLSRNADVLLAIHGMALTYVANMDGTGRWAGCRTLIELMHWVKPDRFHIYREMAHLNNISHVKLLPKSVVFGPSVRHPEKEKRLLMKPNYYWWNLAGFDDQEVTADLPEMHRVLRAAWARLGKCRTELTEPQES